MAVFNVPVVIGVNEEEITKQIENEVKERCISNIQKEVRSLLYEKTYRGREVNEPLRNMVTKEIEKTIEKHQDTIIEMAAEKLADKLSRYKAVREKAAAIADDIL